MSFSKPSLISIISLSLLLSACSEQVQAAGSGPNQASLCEVKQWQRDVTAGACKPGQKVVFLPQNWGNEQLPILFAAVNCDMRYSVALTNGGVTCIYAPTRP